MYICSKICNSHKTSFAKFIFLGEFDRYELKWVRSSGLPQNAKQKVERGSAVMFSLSNRF